MSVSPAPTGRDLAVRDAYRAGELSVAEIRAAFDVTQSELYRILARAREPFRRPASANPRRRRRGARPGDVPALSLVSAADPAGLGRLETRLMRLLSERIAELEAAAAPGRSADPERNARALAVAVRTLAALRRADPAAQEPAAPDAAADAAERPPRSLSELRDELLGHLERIRDEERSPGGDAPPPSDAA